LLNRLKDSTTTLDRASRNCVSIGANLSSVEQFRIGLSEVEIVRIARLAERLLEDEPTLASTAPFGDRVSTGLGPWPALALEDHSAISLFDPDGDIAYSYRALLLAGEDDLVAISVGRSSAFETYCRDVLGLGRAEILVPAAASRERSFAQRCASDISFVDRLVARARASGGLNVVPYMGTGAVWRLAGVIADRAGAQVRVAAPPPRLTARVNDKLWFAERVAEVLERAALPPSHTAFSMWALVRRLKRLAKSHANVAVRLPSSAGSQGNFVLAAHEVDCAPPEDLVVRLEQRLLEAGWRREFPLLATGWEQPVVASPSVQVWVPPASEAPVVEGIFDQLLTEPRARFAGAAPTSLPADWQRRLAREAFQLACLFQGLGYFGRCSFDAIIVGDHAGWQLHWVECNGRWGGVSIPMTLVNRIAGDWRRRPFVVVDRCNIQGTPHNLAMHLERLDDLVLVPGKRDTGLVILSPGRLEAGTGFEIMILQKSVDAARAQAAIVNERLLASMEVNAA
jgi:hypothetical protein